MKHALVVVLFAIALVGAVGMFCFGDSVIGVVWFLKPSFTVDDQNLVTMELMWMLLSATFFLAASGAIAIRLGSGTINPKYPAYKALGAGSGTLLAMAANALLCAVLDSRLRLQKILDAPAAPTDAELDEFVGFGRFMVSGGCGMLVIATLLLLIMAILEWREGEYRRTNRFWSFLSYSSLFVIMVAPIFMQKVFFAGLELQRIVSGGAPAKLEFIVDQLQSILSGASFLFGCFILVGLIQTIAYLVESSPVQDETPSG
ncbi:MAG: hypothetical protein R3C18_27980 [Planctomycetaceae bacterium]